MELKQLKAFEAVASAGSLGPAATQLGVSQATLSREIRLLEDYLGAPLFYRDGRGFALTSRGKDFRERVLPCVEALDEACDIFRSEARRELHRVRIGWVGTVSWPIGSHVVRAFVDRNPEAQIQSFGGSSTQIRELLDRGEIDIGLFNSERPPKAAEEELLLSSPLHLVSRAGAFPEEDRLAPIPIAEALERPLFLHGRQHALRRAIDIHASRARLDIQLLAETDESLSLFRLADDVSCGCIAPLSLLRRDELADLSIRRIEPEIRLYYVMAFSGRSGGGYATQLADVIREQVRLGLAEGRLDGELPV